MGVQEIVKELILNIAYLVLIAEVASRIGVIQSAILEERKSKNSQIILSLFFGGVIIFSTVTSVNLGMYRLNTRVIGAMSAGLLGGPLIGFFASIIGAIFVKVYTVPAVFANSSAFTTLIFGLLGAGFYPYFQRGRWQYRDLFLLAAFAEIAEMCCMVRLNVSIAMVLSVLLDAAIPMIVVNSVGILIFISCFNTVFIRQDIEMSNQVHRMTELSTKCIPYLKYGLMQKDKMQSIVSTVLDVMKWEGAVIVDAGQVMAEEVRIRIYKEEYLNDLKRCAKEALAYGKTVSYERVQLPSAFEEAPRKVAGEYLLVAEPLKINDRTVGAIAVMIKKQWFGNNYEKTLLSNFATLCSHQLSLGELERQESMRQKAEIQALQFQINPHFLFNALNTIAYVCREDAERARELLMTLADYFRYHLGGDAYMVPVEEELDHVKAYLELEHARFEEKLEVIYDLSGNLDFEIPSLILQPLVENAVRYGIGEKGKRTVHIIIAENENNHIIKIIDFGKGFPPEVLQKLYNNEVIGSSIGLTNVQQRMISIYGAEYGLVIDTGEKGTTVELHFPVSV